jgi:crotonobetainyl-CoA:carnitine CoA-transferase CaiB-like acyl-CoA transferase
MPEQIDRLIDEAWSATVFDDRGPVLPPPGHVEVVGARGDLMSPLPVADTAVACVAAALLAAMALQRERGGSWPDVTLDRRHVAAAVLSENFFRRGGEPASSKFAPLSRFWATADGWVRTQANYSWHRAALVSTLGTSEDPDAVAAAMAEMKAHEIEDQVFGAGGVAAAVRSVDAWRAHPQGRAVESEPLIGHRVLGQAAPKRRPLSGLPAGGVRVVDLTRVIAGPVCTRYLGALGADVLRFDPPGRPDMEPGAMADTLLGKRSSMVELASAEGLATLYDTLASADVVVHGYRPGSLDRFGLGTEDLAERYPGLVVVGLDAWGHRGPWADRRGFDSIVQAASGIAVIESRGGEKPGALPCQLLDHGTGYLTAAAVLDGLRRQAVDGGTHVAWLSLAGTARWLTSAPTDDAEARSAAGPDAGPFLVELASPDGPVTAVAPPGRVAGRPLSWPLPLTGYGDGPSRWSE